MHKNIKWLNPECYVLCARKPYDYMILFKKFKLLLQIRYVNQLMAKAKFPIMFNRLSGLKKMAWKWYHWMVHNCKIWKISSPVSCLTLIRAHWHRRLIITSNNDTGNTLVTTTLAINLTLVQYQLHHISLLHLHMNISQGSMRLVINLYIWIYSQIFIKIKYSSYRLVRAMEVKNQKLKILCQTPFQ